MEIVHYSPYLLGPDTGSGNSMRAWCEAMTRVGARVRALHDATQARRAAPEGVPVEGVDHRLNGRVRIPVGLQEQYRPLMFSLFTAGGRCGTSRRVVRRHPREPATS